LADFAKITGKLTWRTVRRVAICIAAMAAVTAVRGQAPVTFRVVGAVTGTADVVTAGTLVTAQYATAGGATETVNGVPFTGGFTGYVKNGGGTATGALNGGTTGNSAYDTILNAFAWDGLPGKLTLTGLTSGSNYMVELWCLDDRSGENARQLSLSDTLGNSTFPFSEGSNTIIEGFFTASGASQVINLTGLTQGSTNTGNLNAFQVRTAPAQSSAGIKILVLGSSQSLATEPDAVTQYTSTYADEAPFPAGPVAAQLAGIMSNDPALSGTTLTVTGSDMFQTQVYSGSGVSGTLGSCTLMSWYYWPSSRAATMALLDQGWNYVVMIDDPYYGSSFPEYSFEGVRAIAQEVRKFNTVPLLVMTWSSTDTALSGFAQMTYRAGAAEGVQVVPAGYVWNSLSGSLKGSGTRPNLQGNYATAAAVYSQIFGRSAATSNYVPGGMTQSNANSIAGAALSSVVTQGTATQFTGTYIGPTHFESPLNQSRLWRYTDFNSSTEYGIRDGLYSILGLGRISWFEYYGAYQSFVSSGFPYDFCQTRFFYEADPTEWTAYGTFDYQDNSGTLSMVAGVDDGAVNDLGLPEQDSCAADVIAMLPYDPEEFFVPVRVFWSRVESTHPEINPQPDGHHMGTEYNQGTASMMYTLLTGRCVVGTQPSDGPPNEDWELWYCRKTGYEIAWQYATLQERVPGFEALPANANTTVQPNGTTTMTARFLYQPKGNVTVNVSCDNAGAATVSPGTLTFTPQNYNVTQTVTVSGVAGTSNRSFHVNFLTSSTDSIFNGLSDSWPYTNVTVPSPWTDADVGTVTQAGSATVTGGTFTMQGAGTNNWGTADAFNLCYQPVTGDAVIIARVLGVQRTSSLYSTGVITFRNSLQASDVNVTMNADTTGAPNQYPAPAVDLTWRATMGGNSTDAGWTGRSYTPEWMKLVRSGTSFSAYYGTDGVHWTQEGSPENLPISQSALVGVGASGNDTTDLATTMMDNVSIQQILPVINVMATGSSASKQGPTPGQYTITRSGSASMIWPLTVNYTMGGTAAAGSDYMALTGSAVIPAGVASAVVTITPVTGSTPDGDQSAVLTLTSNAAYTTGTAASATVVIHDTPFNVWRLANFTEAQLNDLAVSGPMATPANDGIPVLLKYALNLPPLAPGQAGLPVASGSNGAVMITYSQLKSATDITYIPEVSTDLANWHSGAGYVSTISLDNGSVWTVNATSLLPQGSNPRQFMRLQVTMP